VKNENAEGRLLGDISHADESVITELLKEEGPLGPDEILEFTGLEPAKLPVLLLRMELAGKIKRTQEGKYSLK
jgi:predicted Rossmann fold nucleotide-binding protein DprA/Smf involved in DNA uptake